MTTKSNCFLASGALALLICLTSCGKKEEPAPTNGAQSAHGKMLEAAQKTVDDANARTERVEKSAD